MKYDNDKFYRHIINNNLRSFLTGKENFVPDETSNPSDRITRLNKSLIESAKRGDINTSLVLIKSGAEINHKEKFGDTALKIAIIQQYYELAKFLIDHGANITGTESEKLLVMAAEKNDLPFAEQLIKTGTNLNRAENGHETPLIAAAGTGIEMTRLLIRYGADVNGGSNGINPLITAIYRGKMEIARELIKNNARANFNNQYCVMAFHNACFNGDIDRVITLIGFGIDIECIDDFGYTGLMAASFRGHVNVVEFLISRCANIHQKTYNRQNALQYCLSQINPSCINGCLQVARLLLNNGSDVDIVDSFGNTTLSATAIAPYPEHVKTALIKTLIEMGADVNAIFPNYSYFPKNILFWSITDFNKEVFALVLKKKGMDIFSKDRRGVPAVIRLLNSGNNEMTGIFIENSSIMAIASIITA